MAVKIGINGFGRIGRCVVRRLIETNATDIEVVAVNDLADAGMLAHLLKYDTVHRTFPGDVSFSDGVLNAGGKQIKVIAERDPAKLPWKELGVDLVMECTGLFRTREKAQLHVDAGAKKVLVSAPAKQEDITIVVGVNDDQYDADKHHIVSCGSCTTNCLAPPTKVLLNNFGIKHGLLTTIHAYTNGQALLDVPNAKGDKRRARAGAMNLVPTTTGAAKAVKLVVPEVEGKFDGLAMRAPTMDVSIVDLAVVLEKDVTVDEVNGAMKKAANEGPMKDVLDYTEEHLVSTDFIGCPASSTVDGSLTQVMGGNLVKLFAWYDNEWGFSCRMVDLTRIMMGINK
ncbi:MAG: type I glyceraldehyde-3-phosphate dehydrogenase [Deltaproteobacteria bacterium]|jgi:glyceraldehyde 3-phosphate dehydrogenase|nr:type I glyceraldehyde-3-phosphate dehydrogenase [Deltaproteobacteria bacterium]MBW2535515.1 type I glyceraldehyde-3-phosphate dehydrogenase [Deltaproteobacteria bacterium]